MKIDFSETHIWYGQFLAMLNRAKEFDLRYEFSFRNVVFGYQMQAVHEYTKILMAVARSRK